MRVNSKIVYSLLLLLPLCACDRQGPFERAGEKVDNAVKDARPGHPTTGDKVDRAVDDAKDGLHDAKKDLER